MAPSRLHYLRMTPVLAGLLLAGCGPPSALDCTTLQRSNWLSGVITSHSAATDSAESALASTCAAFASLRDSLERTSPVPDSSQALALGKIIRSQESMASTLHERLAASVSDVFQDLPPTGIESLQAEHSEDANEGAPKDYAGRLTALTDHVARFDSASMRVRKSTRRRSAGRTGALMGLRIALLDSLHAMLRTSLVRATLAVDERSTPQLDSLGAEITRLGTVHTAYAESYASFLSTLGGSISPLGGAAEAARTRELVWQLRQRAGLLRHVLLVLEKSAQRFLAEGDQSAGYRMEDSAARLGDAVVVLERHSETLEFVRSRSPGGEEDSLRLIAGVVQDELLRQERILAGLRSNLSALGEADRMRRSVQILERATVLFGDVHREMNALVEALLAQLGGDLQHYGVKIFLTILFLLLSFVVIRAANWLLDTVSERSASRRLFYKRLIPIARLAVWSLTLYVVLAFVFQLDQRSLFAAATALGVAIGFAAQNILKNIFGGIIIIFDQPFQVGDKIRVGGTYGEVVSIGLRATRIVTPDDNEVTVPNAQMIDSQVANANTGSLNCQVVIELFVPGWSDVMKAKAIAYSAAANSKYVYMGKPIVVNVQDIFKETFLTRLTVKAYVLDTRYEFAFASDITESAKAEFKRHGYFSQLEAGGLPRTAP